MQFLRYVMSEAGKRLIRWGIILTGVSLLCLALFVMVAADLCHSQTRDERAITGASVPHGGITVLVENPGTVDCRAEPVTVGVPFPREANIVSTEHLSLNHAGTGIPCQMKVLSRWGRLDDPRAPIRWLLLDFQADVPSRKTETYALVPTTRPAPGLSGIVAKDTPAGVEISTGALSFIVLRDSFPFLRQVKVDGLTIGGDTSPGGIVIERHDDIYSSAFDRPEVAVEEAGPLRTVIRIRGKFRGRDGKLLTGGDARICIPEQKIVPKAENYPLSYTFRLTAFQGKNFVRGEFTLENNGNSIASYYPVNDLFLDAVNLRIPAGISGPVTVRGGGFAESLRPTDRFLLYQGYTDRGAVEMDGLNFSYRASVNDKVNASGRRYPGYLDISGERGGVTVAIPRFWQNAPKSIGWYQDNLRLGILPREQAVPETAGPFSIYSQGNYYFSGGWHKTTELFLTYHGPEFGQRDVDRVQSRLETPLVARCEPSWYAGSAAFGLIAPVMSGTSSKETGEAVDYYERYQKMFVDGHFEHKGRDIVTLRETRALGRGHYGWENFGDMVTGDGIFSSLHYDWPYIMWLQFVRSGDRRFRDLAVEMTEHSADLDQIHTGSPGRHFDGIWQWEDIGGKHVNYHHKSTQGAGFDISHTWNGGYALGYLLTGNNRYREAAELSAEAGRRRWKKALEGQKVVDNQSRTQGWSILMLVNLYRISGDPQLLKDALAIFRNSLLHTEQLPTSPGSGGKGYVTSTGSYKKELSGKVILTMAAYPLEPLCDLHLEARNAGLKVDDLEAYILRSLKWLKGYAYVGGKTDRSGRYSFLTISYATDPVNPANNQGGDHAHNIHVAGAFAYASRMLRDRDPRLADEYLAFARQLFRDQMLHMYEPKRTKTDFHEPSERSSVGWVWMPVATKIIGFIGRGGQPYLYTEYELARAAEKEKNGKR